MLKIVALVSCFVGSYLLLATFIAPTRTVVFNAMGFGINLALLCAAMVSYMTVRAIK